MSGRGTASSVQPQQDVVLLAALVKALLSSHCDISYDWLLLEPLLDLYMIQRCNPHLKECKRGFWGYVVKDHDLIKQCDVSFKIMINIISEKVFIKDARIFELELFAVDAKHNSQDIRHQKVMLTYNSFSFPQLVKPIFTMYDKSQVYHSSKDCHDIYQVCRLRQVVCLKLFCKEKG